MEITCSFAEHDSKYLCLVQSLKVEYPNIQIKSFNGKHMSGKSNEDVKLFKIQHSDAHFFPQGIGNIFPNLLSVYIIESGIRTISREDLAGLTNLEDLYLCRNKLRSLPSNLLLGMGKLMRVSFGCNDIEYVSSDLLRPLINNQMEEVYFQGNPCFDKFYKTGKSNGMKTLADLMKFIDKNCKKPLDEVDGVFVAKKAQFRKLLETGQYSDFTIVADSGFNVKEFKVHRNILGSQSAVFQAIFEADMEEKQSGKMKIEDFRAEVVEELLCFAYTEDIPGEENAMDLFALAAKYDFGQLKNLCEEIILRNIVPANALDVLYLGYLYNSEVLKTKAFKEIKETFPQDQLKESLKNNPDQVRKLLDARETLKREQADAWKKYAKVMEECTEGSS